MAEGVVLDVFDAPKIGSCATDTRLQKNRWGLVMSSHVKQQA